MIKDKTIIIILEMKRIVLICFAFSVLFCFVVLVCFPP